MEKEEGKVLFPAIFTFKPKKQTAGPDHLEGPVGDGLEGPEVVQLDTKETMMSR